MSQPPPRSPGFDATAATAAVRSPDADATVLHHHAVLGSAIVHDSSGHAVELFGNLPIWSSGSMPGPMAARIAALLHDRKTDARSADALEQLTKLNDKLAEVLGDAESGLILDGVPVRGCDLLAVRPAFLAFAARSAPRH